MALDQEGSGQDHSRCAKVSPSLIGGIPKEFLKIYIVSLTLLVVYEFDYQTAVDCGDPGTPANGHNVNSTYTYSHVISFQCMPGYFMTGVSSVTCQANSKWTGTKPTCTGK